MKNLKYEENNFSCLTQNNVLIEIRSSVNLGSY